MVTGNTIVDVINLGLESGAKDRTGPEDDFLLLTLHREENVDVEQKLRNIVKGVDDIARKYNLRVRFPAHPRTSKRLKEHNISLPDTFVVTPPIGYIEFLRLERSARMILTDSGGVQEEACVLGTPCVTLRASTERQETIHVGANYLAGLEPSKMVLGADKMMKSSRSWSNPFGDGRASGRIVRAVASMNGKMIE
jgi:UDP-N-acetylglucosamine 2-epimerase (non-hydrolysing)